MTQTVTALYDTYDSAASAVNALEASGIPHSDISIVSSNVDNRYSKGRPTNAVEDAGKGAGIGATVGAVGGLLTGLGRLTCADNYGVSGLSLYNLGIPGLLGNSVCSQRAAQFRLRIPALVVLDELGRSMGRGGPF